VEFTDRRWKLWGHWSWSRSPSRLLMETVLGQWCLVKIGGAVETVAALCSDGDGVEVLPVTTALPHLDRTRVRNCRWEKGGGELRYPCPGSPPLLFIAQCDRGPPTIVGLGASDQGAGSSPIGRWPY
jgi:hypothetical protein